MAQRAQYAAVLRYDRGMHRIACTFALIVMTGWASPRAMAADLSRGKTVFQQRCLICHSAQSRDGGGAMGPTLAGVFGQPAARVAGFSYTDALRNSHLTWDDATLERFLSAPTNLVPGTAMITPVESPQQRVDLISYLQSLRTESSAQSAPPLIVPRSSRVSADWRLDKPGRSHRIRLGELPPPLATASARNNSQVIARPAAAALRVPRGFRIDTFADGLKRPRKMLQAANGDVLITEISIGQVSILHPSRDGTHAMTTDVYVGGLKQPFGIAFYPNAKAPEWLYIAETDRIIRYAYQTGDLNPHGAAQVVVAELPHGAGHVTRDIAFSADGSRLFVAIGSASNDAEDLSPKSTEEIAAWEAIHGTGAAWDEETNRALVLSYDAAAPRDAQPFATGVRNCVSLTLQPANGALWCTTNERDALGDDLVPDYSTRLTQGGFYGWPWYYFGAHQDPRHSGERADLADKALVPDVPYQAHSAALSMTFYVANAGKSAFPDAYAGDAFVAFHGSWNRSLHTGYKLVRVRMNGGVPTGEYEDFVTGFIVDDAKVWGRPVATLELADGSLLLSDDASNSIYRISHGH